MLQKKLQTKLNDKQVENRLEAVRDFSQLDEFPEELFVKALGDSDWRVRKEVVSWFIQLPDSSSRSAIVLEQLQHPENAGLRNAAIEILIGLGGQAIPDLTKQLAVSDAEVRKFIVDILGEIGSPRCVQELLPVLHDEDENVRYAAVETLGKLGATAAVEPLLDLLDTADAGLRFTIFAALSSIGSGVTAERILPYCNDPLLRKTVFGCLGQIGDPQGITPLLEGLSDPLRKVREAAVIALGPLINRLDAQVVLSVVEGQPVKSPQYLLELLSHQNLEMRAAACHILSLSPGPEVIEQLLPLLAEEELRPHVVAAFKRMPQADLVSQFSGDVPAEKAVFLIYLAGELQLESVAPLAMRMVTAEDPQLRYASVLTLGKIAHVAAAPRLSDVLADEIQEIKAAAVDALKQLGAVDDDAVIASVSPYLESSDAELRLLAVRILGSLAAEKVEDCLLMALKDFSAPVRCEALRGLKGSSSDRLLTGFSLALTDEVADVRRLAAEALEAFSAAQSLMILSHAVDDADPWVRMAAIRALQGGDRQELQVILERGLGDPVGLVVIAALEAVVRLLPEAAEDKLLGALQHQDEEVMKTALRLLLSAGSIEKVLNHQRQQVRLGAVSELVQSAAADWRNILETRLASENDPVVRQTIDMALRHSAEG